MANEISAIKVLSKDQSVVNINLYISKKSYVRAKLRFVSVYHLLLRIISVKFRVILLIEVSTYIFSISEAQEKLYSIA